MEAPSDEDAEVSVEDAEARVEDAEAQRGGQRVGQQPAQQPQPWRRQRARGSRIA